MICSLVILLCKEEHLQDSNTDGYLFCRVVDFFVLLEYSFVYIVLTFFTFSSLWVKDFVDCDLTGIEIVKRYAIHQHAAEVARQFQSRFDRTPPTSKKMLSLVQKLDETKSVEDQSRSCRARSVSTDENSECVRAAVEEKRATSIRSSL